MAKIVPHYLADGPKQPANSCPLSHGLTLSALDRQCRVGTTDAPLPSRSFESRSAYCEPSAGIAALHTIAVRSRLQELSPRAARAATIGRDQSTLLKPDYSRHFALLDGLLHPLDGCVEAFQIGSVPIAVGSFSIQRTGCANSKRPAAFLVYSTIHWWTTRLLPARPQ